MGSMGLWHMSIMMMAIVMVPIFWIVPAWRILQRTGHSGAWALLGFVPVLNLILLWMFAFSEWPVDRDRRASVQH